MAYSPTEWTDGEPIRASNLNKAELGIKSANDSYVPTEWHPGDLITAERLNKMEDGIASAGGGGDVLVVSFSADPNTGTITADKTYADTMAAINANKLVLGASSGTLLTLNGTSGTSLEFVTEYWMPSQNKLLVMMLLFKADNSVEPVAEKQYTLTPAT